MVALTNLKLVRRSWDAGAGESRRNAKKHILLNIASASVQISLLRSDTWNIGREADDSTFCAALVIYSPRFLLNLPDSDDYQRECLIVHWVYHHTLSWPYTHSVRKLSWPYTVSLIICSRKAVTAAVEAAAAISAEPLKGSAAMCSRKHWVYGQESFRTLSVRLSTPVKKKSCTTATKTTSM